MEFWEIKENIFVWKLLKIDLHGVKDIRKNVPVLQVWCSAPFMLYTERFPKRISEGINLLYTEDKTRWGEVAVRSPKRLEWLSSYVTFWRPLLSLGIEKLGGTVNTPDDGSTMSSILSGSNCPKSEGRISLD